MKMRAMQTVATRPMLHGAREFDATLGRDLIRLVRVGDGEGVKLMWEEARGKVDPNVVDKHGQRETPVLSVLQEWTGSPRILLSLFPCCNDFCG